MCWPRKTRLEELIVATIYCGAGAILLEHMGRISEIPDRQDAYAAT